MLSAAARSPPLPMERRRHLRLMVEGLALWIEGVPHEIIDISVNAARVTYADPDLMRRWQRIGNGLQVPLVLYAKPGYPPLKVRLPGTLRRWDANFAVLGYVQLHKDWLATLKRYDTLHASADLIDVFQD